MSAKLEERKTGESASAAAAAGATSTTQVSTRPRRRGTLAAPAGLLETAAIDYVCNQLEAVSE